MTSPPPLLYETYYHIYNRGVNGEDIFVEERNYDLFLKLWERHLIPVADLFAYCLLRNHFHLSVRIKSEEEILEKIETLRVSRINRKKTLKVSTPNLEHEMPGSFASREENSQRKPLGFDSSSLGSRYVSDQFSNFFNAYAKTINKAYGRTGSLFQHPFGRVPITTDRHYSPRSVAEWEFWNVIAYMCDSTSKTRRSMDL